MKAVVAVPPVYDFYFTPTRASALGAVSVLEILKKGGMDAVLFNFPVMSKKPCRLPLPAELDYLQEFLVNGESGPVSFFSTYKRFGPQIEECAEAIRAESPDILFISCFAWAYAEEAVRLAEAVKKTIPGIITVAGGAGVTVNPEYFRQSPAVDYSLEGEAEKILPAFVAGLYGNTGPGGTGPLAAAGMGSGPLAAVAGAVNMAGADESLFRIARVGTSEKRRISYYSAILTRGCPKSCSFCSNHLVHGRKFRKAGIDSVEVVFKRLSDTLHGIPGTGTQGTIGEAPALANNIHVNFEDDNLLLDPAYFISVLKIIKEKFPDAEFSAENGIDYTLLDEALLDRLISLGFKTFNLSMASSDQQLLKKQHRPSAPDRLTRILKHLEAGNIGAVTYFICGLAGQSPESSVADILYLHRLPTLSGISLYYAVPGLPYVSLNPAGYPPRLCAGSSAFPWNGSLGTKQLVTAFRLSRLSNLIKSSEGRIKSPPLPPACRELLSVILDTGKFHTIKSGKITVAENLDNGMIDLFLSTIKQETGQAGG